MSRLTMWTFPHFETRVDDKSIYNPIFREQLPLHRPAYFMRCQKGIIGVPVWCSTYDEAVANFGEGTFDKNSIYYSREAVFALTTFAGAQGCFIIRLADSTAKYASAIIELHVTATDVPQWERDSAGYYVEDEDGNRVPVEGTGGPGTQATAPGYLLAWRKRELKVNEDYTNIKPKTVTSGLGPDTVIYPILATRYSSPTSAGNEIAFKLYYDDGAVEDAMVDSIGALTYQFQVTKKTYGQDTVSVIRSIYNESVVYAALKDKAVDTRLDKDVALKAVLLNQFYDSYNYVNTLPIDFQLYADNLETVASLVATKELATGNTEVTDPDLYNLLSCTNQDGAPLYTAYLEDLVANAANIRMNKSYLLYLTGGSDGDISDNAIEELTRQYVKDLTYPDIIDQARYPITHIYDTGVALETKKALLSFMNFRDDIKPIISTQDCNRDRWNTADEDMSMQAALQAYAALSPESVLFGVGCCRAVICPQAGYLNNTARSDGLLPFTLDMLIKRCSVHNSTHIKGIPKGLPASGIDIFREWNWTPSSPTVKQKSWDLGGNYAQYYDMHRIHRPDSRTVYTSDTSVLSSDYFTDAVVYTKHIARYQWAVHVGLELPFSRLAEKIKSSVLNDVQTMLNGTYGVSVRVYQTDEERKIGYITHVEIKLIGYASNRIWLVDIPCYRDGYDPEEA